LSKMTSIQMKRILEERLQDEQFRTSFNRDEDTFRIEWETTGEGITITLANVIAKYNERGEAAVDQLVGHILEALRIMNEEKHLQGMEKNIFPVIRAASFPTETKSGISLVTKEHTAETRIFFALDLGKSYQLIDQNLMDKEEWSKDRMEEVAAFNLRSLSTSSKKDTVADNDFYFVAHRDGYDASRILNEAFLEEMKANAKGELVVAVPHQDILILADVQNKSGYDVLAQMTMKFFAEGTIPITALSFVYEDHHLEPVFILANKKPQKKQEE